MSFTLDDAHETLSVAAWMLARLSPWKFAPVGAVVREALDAIEAQLPEPCEHCGSDQCGWPPLRGRFSYHCPEGSRRLGVSGGTGPW